MASQTKKSNVFTLLLLLGLGILGIFWFGQLPTMTKRVGHLKVELEDKSKERSGVSSTQPLSSSTNACRCPLGSYLTPTKRANRERILNMWCAWLLNQSGSRFVLDDLQENRISTIPNRTWWYYEDPRWPKPHCHLQGVLRVGERGPNSVCNQGQVVYMTSIPDKCAVYHPSKTGSMTIIRYLNKNDNKAFTNYCKQQYTPNNQTVFLSTRSPIKRFVSGLGEILHRNCPARVWKSEETRKICLDNHGLNISGGGTQLLECIIREHECHPGYCASEHLYSQSFFVSRGGQLGDGPSIDQLLQTQDLLTQLPALARMCTAENRSVPTANSGVTKPKSIGQMQHAVEDMLSMRVDLLRIMCRIYMQDMVCFGLDLPKECDKMLNDSRKWARG